MSVYVYMYVNMRTYVRIVTRVVYYKNFYSHFITCFSSKIIGMIVSLFERKVSVFYNVERNEPGCPRSFTFWKAFLKWLTF